MRATKFRAWDVIEKEFAQNIDCLLDIKTSERVFVLDDENGEIIIEQYIGLKDKNGKEIYEGDIVSYRGNNYRIKWCEASFAYIASSKNQYYWLSPSKSDVFEVIGNIHENPELLIKEVELSEEDKAIAEKAAKLIIRDYGEVLKKLGDE